MSSARRTGSDDAAGADIGLLGFDDESSSSQHMSILPTQSAEPVRSTSESLPPAFTLHKRESSLGTGMASSAGAGGPHASSSSSVQQGSATPRPTAADAGIGSGTSGHSAAGLRSSNLSEGRAGLTASPSSFQTAVDGRSSTSGERDSQPASPDPASTSAPASRLQHSVAQPSHLRHVSRASSSGSHGDVGSSYTASGFLTPANAGEMSRSSSTTAPEAAAMVKRESVGGDLSNLAPGFRDSVGFSPVMPEMPAQSAAAGTEARDSRRPSAGSDKAGRRASRASGSSGRRRGSVAERAAAAAAAVEGGQGVEVPNRQTSLHTRKGSSGTSKAATGKGRARDSKGAAKLSVADRHALQRWILSVGCVTFDLEVGPDLEFLYPPLGISKEEKDNIAFSSFPDTSIFDDGSTTFSWRVREVPLDSSESEAPVISGLGLTQLETTAGASSPGNPPSPGPLSEAGQKASPKSSPLPSSGFNLVRQWSSSLMQHSPGSSRASSPAPLSPGGGAAGSSKAPMQQPSAASVAARALHAHSRNGSSTSTDTNEGVGQPSDLTSPGAMKDLEARTSGLVQQAEGTASDAPALAPAAIIAPAGKNRKGGGSTSSSYIYGVCYFRQKRDPSIRRGYFQKSVVILSHLPYVSLLTDLVAKLGALYFEHGQPMLEAFVQDVVRWPAPEPGLTLSLPVLGSVLKVALPIGSQFQTDAATNAYIPSATNPNMATSLLTKKKITQPGRNLEPEPLLASIPTTMLIDTFKEAIPDLWLLWECMLLADPILVIAPDPKACSEAIWHLLDLIRPIPYAGDFRPYFHIHDYDCRALVTKNKPQAGTLLGVTNPFFVSACAHWPNLLRVGRGTPKTSHHFGLGRSASNGKKPSAPGVAGGMSAGGGGPDHQPGLLSKRKRRASKDRPLLKALVEAVEKQENVEAANGMLRRYFSDLTERFLQPLNRYVASLVPSAGEVPTSPGEPLRIRPFNTGEFLASLKAHGTPLLLKNRSLPTGAAVRQSLYVDFLQCPNFSLWLHAKMAAAEEDNWGRRIKALETGDVQRFVQCNGEIEAIDLFSRLREEIKNVDARIEADMSSVGPGQRWRTDGLADSQATSASMSASSSRTGSEPGAASLTPLSSIGQPAAPTSASATAPAPEQAAAGGLAATPPVTAGTGAHDAGGGAAGAAKLAAPPTATANAANTGSYGRTLAAKRHRLLDQLDKVADMLPADLKSSLRLKDRESERLTALRAQQQE